MHHITIIYKIIMFVVSVAAGRTMQAISIKTFYELRNPPSSVFSFETKQLIQGTFELKSENFLNP